MIKRLYHRLKNDLTAQLILVVTVLLLGTTGAMNIYYFSQEQEGLKRDLIDYSRSLARMLASNSRLGVFTDDIIELESQAQMIFSEPECSRVVIYDEEGNVLVNIQNQDFKARTAAQLISITHIYQNITDATSKEALAYPSNKAIVLAEPILVQPAFSDDGLYMDEEELQSVSLNPVDKRSIGHVALVMSTHELDKKIQIFKQKSITVSVVVAIFSSLLIYLIIRSLTSPLLNLSNKIARHQKDNDLLGEQLSPSETDFKKMIAIIDRSYHTISSLKNNLEKTVAERTDELTKSNKELAKQTIDLGDANQKLAATLEELQQTQSQLVQSEKMAALGKVIGGLSHEINNSVNFISSSMPLLENNLSVYNQALKNSQKEPTQLKRAAANTDLLLDNIKEGVRRITGVINDLRHFSYSRGDKFELTDIHTGLASSISILRHEYQNRINFIEDFSREFPKIDGISGQLNQVFMNILLNAVHAIEDQGTISVTTKQQGENVSILIKDSGCGIPDDNISNIFTPFYSTREVGKGSGMGLSISYSIVKKHNGEIIVESTPGQGTTFEVVLPQRHIDQMEIISNGQN